MVENCNLTLGVKGNACFSFCIYSVPALFVRFRVQFLPLLNWWVLFAGVKAQRCLIAGSVGVGQTTTIIGCVLWTEMTFEEKYDVLFCHRERRGCV